MSFRQFLKEKDNGFKQSSYLLYGTDPFFLKEAEKIIREGVDKDQRDFGIDSYDFHPASDTIASFSNVLDSLNTFPFFSEKKLVMVHNIQKFKQAEITLLQDYLLNPSDNSILFLFYYDALKTNKRKAFARCKIISLDHTSHELREWLFSYAKERGVSLTSHVSEYLIGMLGNDAGLLASEVNKFSLLGKENIELKDLEGIIYGIVGVNTFEFTKAIIASNKIKAFALANELRNTEPNMLLGALNWQISRNKTHLSGLKMFQYYRTLLEADLINKSTGSTYPLELLITKLLSR